MKLFREIKLLLCASVCGYVASRIAHIFYILLIYTLCICVRVFVIFYLKIGFEIFLTFIAACLLALNMPQLCWSWIVPQLILFFFILGEEFHVNLG